MGDLAPEGFEVVTVQRSFFDSFIDRASGAHPETMATLGMFVNTLCGRIFLLQSSKLTDELMAQFEDGLCDVKFGGIGTVITYHTLVMASVLKKRLQTHHFYSKHCVDVLESNPKRSKRSNDPDLLYKCRIRKSVEGICDTAIALENIIGAEKKLYNEVVEGNLLYPNFLSSCLQQIEDHKATLKEQVINHELKQRIEREKEEVKFLGELCSRLLVVTPLEKPQLINAFLKTKDILNYVNGIKKP